MSLLGRGTLPQNYVDFLNATEEPMRLITPEPQYFFAQLALGAQLRTEALRVGFNSARAAALAGAAGAELSADLDRMVRVTDLYPDAVMAVNEFGSGRGDTIKFDRDVYLPSGGAYTEQSRRLATGQKIPKTGQLIQQEQVPVTLFQYYGPTDGNGGVSPYRIHEFENQFRAAKESLVSKTTRHLKRDYVKFIDTSVRDLFRATDNVTVPEGVSAATDFAPNAGHGIDLPTILNARKAISDREWRPFSNGRYMLLVPTSFNTTIATDPDYQKLSLAHEDGRNLIYGYVTSIQDLDIFEVTTLRKYTDGETIPGLAGTVPVGATVNEALLIGPQAVGFGKAESDTVKSPMVKYDDDTNFGLEAGVIWYALHAFATLDTRGIQRILFQE